MSEPWRGREGAAECDRRESSHRTMDEEEEEKNQVADLYSGSEDRK